MMKRLNAFGVVTALAATIAGPAAQGQSPQGTGASQGQTGGQAEQGQGQQAQRQGGQSQGQQAQGQQTGQQRQGEGQQAQEQQAGQGSPGQAQQTQGQQAQGQQAQQQDRRQLKVIQLEHRDPQQLTQLFNLWDQVASPAHYAQTQVAYAHTGGSAQQNGEQQQPKAAVAMDHEKKLLFVRGSKDQIETIESLIDAIDVEDDQLKSHDFAGHKLIPIHSQNSSQVHSLLSQLELSGQMIRLGNASLVAYRTDKGDSAKLQQAQEVINQLSGRESEQPSGASQSEGSDARRNQSSDARRNQSSDARQNQGSGAGRNNRSSEGQNQRSGANQDQDADEGAQRTNSQDDTPAGNSDSENDESKAADSSSSD